MAKRMTEEEVVAMLRAKIDRNELWMRLDCKTAGSRRCGFNLPVSNKLLENEGTRFACADDAVQRY